MPDPRHAAMIGWMMLHEFFAGDVGAAASGGSDDAEEPAGVFHEVLLGRLEGRLSGESPPFSLELPRSL